MVTSAAGERWSQDYVMVRAQIPEGSCQIVKIQFLNALDRPFGEPLYVDRVNVLHDPETVNSGCCDALVPVGWVWRTDDPHQLDVQLQNSRNWDSDRTLKIGTHRVYTKHMRNSVLLGLDMGNAHKTPTKIAEPRTDKNKASQEANFVFGERVPGEAWAGRRMD